MPQVVQRALIGYCQLSGQALYDAGDGKESVFPSKEMELTCKADLVGEKNTGTPEN